MSLSSARTSLGNIESNKNSQKSTLVSAFKSFVSLQKGLYNNASSFTATDYSAFDTARSNLQSNMASMTDLLHQEVTQMQSVYNVLVLTPSNIDLSTPVVASGSNLFNPSVPGWTLLPTNSGAMYLCNGSNFGIAALGQQYLVSATRYASASGYAQASWFIPQGSYTLSYRVAGVGPNLFVNIIITTSGGTQLVATSHTISSANWSTCTDAFTLANDTTCTVTIGYANNQSVTDRFIGFGGFTITKV